MLHPSNRALSFKLVLAALSFVPTIAFAEVSDKEPTLLYVWLVGIVASLVCLAGTYYRRWLAPILAALPFLWFASLLIEIHSADVGPYLYAEQGMTYYVQTYLSLAVFVAGLLLGLFLNGRRNS